MSSVINFEDFKGVPARAINMSTRNMLAFKLDVNDVSWHLQKNWMGLAELLGYNYEQIKHFDTNDNCGKTRMLLDDYTMKGRDIADLLQCLHQLERYDILEDVDFQCNLQRDVDSYLAKQQTTQRPSEQTSLQDPEVTSAGATQFGQFFEHEDDDKSPLTVGDSMTGLATMYDAYVIYADENFEFVKEMITQLEQKFGLRLCIANRDMLAGAAQFHSIAAIIKKRCTKVIVVMSPAFRKSPMCTFATNFAFSLCPSTLRGTLVPILFEPCQIPDILLYIAPLDFTKVEYIQWFWERLQHSLKHVHVTAVRSLQREEPPPYDDTVTTFADVSTIPCKVRHDASVLTQDPDGAMADVPGAIGGTSETVVLPNASNGNTSNSSRKVPSAIKKKKTLLTRIKEKAKQ